MSDQYQDVFELDSIYQGGSSSTELKETLEKAKETLDHFISDIKNWNIPESKEDSAEFLLLINQQADISKNLMNASSYLECLASADVTDEKAVEISALIYAYDALLQTAEDEWHQKFVQIEDLVWEELLQINGLDSIHFVLNEARENRKLKGSKTQEEVINALSVDGYQGWSDHYDTIVNNMRIKLDEKKEISPGQALNLLNDPDHAVRKATFKAYTEAWQNNRRIFADTLNHLAGFRLAKYAIRDTKEVLNEPLTLNRMQPETLKAMWHVIREQKPIFVSFLERKAKLLGLEKLSFYDVEAPLLLEGEPKKYSYQEGAEFILRHFNAFSPKMAEFAEHAFKNRWIEAENRDNKRPGGFCTDFPINKESRIFMTYDGAPGTVATLAHELGHAFHSYVLRDEPYENTHYAMNVAETASTFAEMIIADAAVKEAKTKAEKITLLEDKIGRSIAFFMNIHARFLFETRFYEARKKGVLTANSLNRLMEEAQREAYMDSLAEYHPEFWASKLHFYIADVPFYNFPYTFGYLFSLGIYQHARKTGSSYEDDYIALLKDTGKMTTEELAQKHLGVDLTTASFWEDTLAVTEEDVREFLRLTEDM
ncbi:M3 family oligoendopeptidase [Listeria sp. PSOL-1]|uniref:M3 family oligoendopeptidase n=1 Tax=Listeria sp. PSOL-1 TaxID=1844999 RepID=UPI0013D29565|nr:M3 family oligoendopeptidase [Listeria sp. PSOL-1]